MTLLYSILYFWIHVLTDYLPMYLQILFHSMEKQYVITNLPWLIGSLGTMVEDAIIFVQFHAFGEKDSAAVV